MMDDLISRQDAIGAIVNTVSKVGNHDNSEVARYGATFRQHEIIDILNGLPSAEPERKTGRLSNKEWIDFLVAQFDVSRTSARDMLHTMMQVKREDDFKKQFNGAKMEVEHEQKSK